MRKSHIGETANFLLQSDYFYSWVLFIVKEFHWFCPQTRGQRRMASWNSLPPPLKGQSLHSEFQKNLFCCMGPTSLKPLKKQETGLVWSKLSFSFIRRRAANFALLSRCIQTDWQFLYILQKIKGDPPGVCPCRHASVFAPGWKSFRKARDCMSVALPVTSQMRISFWKQRKGEISYPRIPVYYSSGE